MTRIVHNNYPVDRLPEELRKALPGLSHVRLIVEDEDAENRARAEINASIDRGLADIAADRTRSMEEVQAEMERLFPFPERRDDAA